MPRRSAFQLVFALLVFASACLSEPGTFDVRFGFRDGPPSSERALFAFAYVERGGTIRVARSEPVRFDPSVSLRFEEVPNGDDYTVVVELKGANDASAATEYFGRSEPFALRPGKHTSVEVALSVRPAPYLSGAGLRIVEAKFFPTLGAFVTSRFVTLELSSREATRVTVADNPNFTGAQTRPLSELESKGEDVYLWRDWDLDQGVCSQLRCADGARELYVRFGNDDNYQSSTYNVRVELDTSPPGLSSSRLLSKTASAGEVVSVLAIAQEPLRAAPVITPEPADFQLSLAEDASDAVPGGLSFTLQYTVDERAQDDQQYRFFAELVDLAGNTARVELADQVTIGSDLVALAATVERSPTFAPFALAPFFSRTDPVTHEPVSAIVRVTSNRAFGAAPKLFGRNADGKQLDLAFDAAQSNERLAVFTHELSATDAAGSYELQVEWIDEAGRAASSQLDPKLELRDDPKPTQLGTVDTGVDAYGEPRTLLIARPWGHITDKGHGASSATLHGWVKQRAKRPEDCIAQVLVHSGTQENGAVRLDSLHGVAAVGGVTSTGCASDQASFATRFAGQPGAFLFATPVTVSGHLGPAQPVVHGEWVATLPPGNLGGTAQHPHALQSLLRKPSVLYARGTSVALPAGSSQLQDLLWETQPPPTVEQPELLYQIMPAYDPNRGRVLLTDNNALTEVWELSGDTWTKHKTTSVTPNGGYLPLAFDSARDRLVCVGGGDWEMTSPSSAKTVNMHQTWEWDGAQWNHLQPQHHPPQGVRALAYDAARQLVVASPKCSDALWLWNGVDWREGPKLGVSDICVQALVYDHVHEQVLAFGNDKQRTRLFSVREEGNKELDSAHRPPTSENLFAAFDSERERLVVYNWSGGEPPTAYIQGSDAWEWDGSDWTQLAPTAFPKSGQFLIYDEAHKSLELFGGVTPSDRYRLDDSGWAQVAGQKMPSARTGQGMIYDAQRKALMIGGGHGPRIRQFEVWERQGGAWLKSQVDVGSRAEHYQASTPLVYDEARGIAVLPNPLSDLGEQGVTNLGTETIAFSGTTRTPVPVADTMPGRVDTAAAYDAARERIVLFGGELDWGGEQLADTWEWDGAQWTARETPTAPSARSRHALAFDRRRQRMVLFGGRSKDFVTLADTWEWDGNTWIERTVSNAPPPRERHALAYDEVRQKIVLFGGSLTDGGPALNDTWEFDGESWTQLFPEQTPAARAGHSLAYDRDRARVVLYGGDNGGQNQGEVMFGDLWEWDGAQWTERSASEYLTSDNLGNTVYDARRGRLVLFGGFKYSAQPSYSLDETWEWDGVRWQQRMPKTAPPARSQALLTFDESRQSVLMVGSETSRNLAQDTWEWDGNDWLQLSAAIDSFSGRLVSLFHDRAEGKTILLGDEGAWRLDGDTWTSLGSSTFPPGSFAQTVYDAAKQELIMSSRDGLWSWAWKTNTWTTLRGQDTSRDRIDCLVYDDDREQVLAITPSAFLEDGMRIAALNGAALEPLTVAGAINVTTCNPMYDRKRKQVVMLINERVVPPPTPYAETQLISRVEPAQRIDIDLTPLVGPARARAVKLDGLAFHARTGADTGADGEMGAALDVWNGRTFRNVLTNAAESGKPDSLCFESSRPETLGGLEADNKWHFLLRPSAESTGRARAQLRTDAYEVRIRYHIGDAEPAIARGGDRACDRSGWALRDFTDNN